MRPRELFGTGVRLIGLWFFTQTFYWGFWTIVKANTDLGNPKIPLREDLAYAIIYFIIAAVMLFLADPIVWLVYGLPPKAVQPDAADNNPTDAKP